MTRLSKRLRELREKKGLTVRALADVVGKSPGYISRVEGRGEVPSPELLCELAEALGGKPEELLDLAKESQLKRIAEEIESRQKSALVLYRKGKK